LIDDDDDGIDRAGGYRRLISDPPGAGAWKVGVNEANEMERGSEFSRELS